MFALLSSAKRLARGGNSVVTEAKIMSEVIAENENGD